MNKLIYLDILTKTMSDLILPSGIFIIGLSGNSGSGKDYVALNMIKEYYNSYLPIQSVILSFADTLKISAIVEDGLSREKVYVKKDYETRKFLQHKGTENGRNKYGEDIWIKYMHQHILNHIERGINTIIIPDVRFPNEVEYIKSNCGKIIYVNAPNRTMNRRKEEVQNSESKLQEISNHPSESPIKTEFDYVLNNDIGCDNSNSVSDFYYFLQEIYRKHLDK